MSIVNVHEAKSQLSRLLAAVEAGEEVIIARDGTPVARLVAIVQPRPKRRFGSLKGRLVTGDAFFETLPREELEAWE
ncbi:MAG TPA: type II toxin-antitoxin system prevent-host-death family antitoxin [Paracoccaceae bacterium]|nr:type II toxin-antitoxin system prevent-host-death family antitoxin [Paracoccaceae bacterium]